MVDGFSSSAILINYMEEVLKPLFPNFSYEYHIPEGKEHGLSSIMEIFTEKRICDLIILPDAGSNDIEEAKILKEIGYEVLVEHHHEISEENPYAVVINNQSSERYSNKELTGAGIVYKFLQYCDKQLKISAADRYLDLTMFALISDMSTVINPESRYIYQYGVSHINNQFLKDLIEKQAYSLGNGPLTQIGIAFYLTPLVNALIRVGNQAEKENLFKSFLNGVEIVPSTKRGEKGQFETISVQSVRNCINAKSRQNKEKEKAMEILDIQIIENCLDENKILILNADELNVSNTLTGLIAMGISAKYKKPVMLGRTNKDGYFKGSARGRNESALKDFRQFLIDSGYMDYAEGHAQAFGQSIKISNIDKLLTYANKKLANVDFNEGFYEVDFIVNGNCSYLAELIEDMENGKSLWGQGNSEPLIVVENIILNPKDISIIGQNHDTIRFTYNGITYIKFKAKDLIEEISSYHDKMLITIVGRSNINEWGGKRTPQILIDGIEIKEESIFDF